MWLELDPSSGDKEYHERWSEDPGTIRRNESFDFSLYGNTPASVSVPQRLQELVPPETAAQAYWNRLAANDNPSTLQGMGAYSEPQTWNSPVPFDVNDHLDLYGTYLQFTDPRQTSTPNQSLLAPDTSGGGSPRLWKNSTAFLAPGPLGAYGHQLGAHAWEETAQHEEPAMRRVRRRTDRDWQPLGSTVHAASFIQQPESQAGGYDGTSSSCVGTQRSLPFLSHYVLSSISSTVTNKHETSSAIPKRKREVEPTVEAKPQDLPGDQPEQYLGIPFRLTERGTYETKFIHVTSHRAKAEVSIGLWKTAVDQLDDLSSGWEEFVGKDDTAIEEYSLFKGLLKQRVYETFLHTKVHKTLTSGLRAVKNSLLSLKYLKQLETQTPHGTPQDLKQANRVQEQLSRFFDDSANLESVLFAIRQAYKTRSAWDLGDDVKLSRVTKVT